jgi:hypothetical protein
MKPEIRSLYKSVVPNLRSRPKSGSQCVWRRVERVCYGERDNYKKKSKSVTEFKQNYRDNIIIEYVLINNKRTGTIT